MTTISTRPENHTERSRCRTFAGEMNVAKVDVIVSLTVTRLYLPAAEAYTATRAANAAAASKVAQDSDRVHAASGAFRVAFDEWVASIDHVVSRGYAVKALPEHLGNVQLSKFLAGTDWSKVTRMETLFAVIAEDATLRGGATELEGVKTATRALGAALAAQAGHASDRATAVKALVAASAAFDRAYGKLVEEILFYDADTVGTKVPRFHRGTTAAPAPEADAVATGEQDAAEAAAAEAAGAETDASG